MVGVGAGPGDEQHCCCDEPWCGRGQDVVVVQRTTEVGSNCKTTHIPRKHVFIYMFALVLTERMIIYTQTIHLRE